MNDGRIWVVWESDRNEKWNFDIHYTIYNWSSWSDPMPLTTHSKQDIDASIMQTNDGTIWLFWSSSRTGNYDLFFKTSSDNGTTWTNTAPLTENSGQDLAPSVIQDTNGTIWVVWQFFGTEDYSDLFCKTSSDNGTTWSNATKLTTNFYNDKLPSIAQMRDGTIWVVWQYSTGTEEDVIACKTYNGSWSNATQLTEGTEHDGNPSIMQARDGTIWVFWSRDFAHGPAFQNDLCYKTSIDNGATWLEDVQLTTDQDWNEDHPSAAQISNKTIWLTWQSNKDDNYDIYYQITDEIISHDVAITSITPSSTIVYQGGTVSINVTAKNQGDFTETFNVTLYVNTTVIENQTVNNLPNGTSTNLTFTWNTTDFAYGNYIISAVADTVPSETYTADNTLVDGTVQVRIIGDIDGDGDVDFTDFYLFIGVYPSNPASDPRADLDGDGDVDFTDFYLFTGHYPTL